MNGPGTPLRPVRAAVLCVNPGGTNGCFATVTAAVNAAAPGDTINVAAGVYQEQINLNKAGIFLRGPQAGTVACGRSGTTNEAVLRHPSGPVQVTANNVTLDGFIVQGGTSGLSAGITTSPLVAGHRLLNNIIQNNTQGIYFNSNGGGPSLVQGNSFRHDANGGARAVNGIYSDADLRNATISQNCFTGQSNTSIVITGAAVQAPEKFSGITISDNTADGEQFLELLFTKNLTISGNRITNAPPANDSQIQVVAISLGGGNAGITIEGNTILNTNAASQNLAPGIGIRDPYGVAVANSDVAIRCNRIVGNLAGGLVLQSGAYQGTVNAENNWWGCNAGPGSPDCDSIPANVDANPWLVMGFSAPTMAIRDAPTPLSATLTRNSAGNLAPCAVPNGTDVRFVSTCGTPVPALAQTVKGEAKATLAPNSLGSCTVSASVDKQALASTLTVMDGPAVTVTPLSANCLGPGDKLVVAVQITNSSSTAQAVTISSTLSPLLMALPQCPTSVGTCTIPNSSTVNYSATLAAGQRGSFSFQVMVSDAAFTNDELCITTTSTLAGVTKTVSNCVKVTCEQVGPGRPLNAQITGGSQQPGSVLVWNVYTSAAASPHAENTRLSLTNTSTSSAVSVHLFFVSKDCQVSDAFVCLTANQTVNFLASDIDPGVTGYVIAVAVDRQTGCPIIFNHLIGDEFIKLTSGHQANLGAEAIVGLSTPLTNCGADGQTATLRFDGASYSTLPAVLALDGIPSRIDNNSMLWFLTRLDGNLATSNFPSGVMRGDLYDDVEGRFATGDYPFVCQLTGPILTARAASGQGYDNVIPAGRTGWLKMRLLVNGSPQGMLGAVLNFNPNTRVNSSAYNQGRLLHKVTFTTTSALTIPIVPPNC